MSSSTLRWVWIGACVSCALAGALKGRWIVVVVVAACFAAGAAGAVAVPEEDSVAGVSRASPSSNPRKKFSHSGVTEVGSALYWAYSDSTKSVCQPLTAGSRVEGAGWF